MNYSAKRKYQTILNRTVAICKSKIEHQGISRWLIETSILAKTAQNLDKFQMKFYLWSEARIHNSQLSVRRQQRISLMEPKFTKTIYLRRIEWVNTQTSSPMTIINIMVKLIPKTTMSWGRTHHSLVIKVRKILVYLVVEELPPLKSSMRIENSNHQTLLHRILNYLQTRYSIPINK